MGPDLDPNHLTLMVFLKKKSKKVDFEKKNQQTTNKHAKRVNTVKPCVTVTLKKDRKLIFKTHYCLMQVKSIAECSLGALCNTFDLH